jgi:PAS domain S-box-containing protein
VLVATGSADGMTVVSVAGGGAEVLRETAIDFHRLSPAAREYLLDGSPAETESLGEALVCGARFGRALLCPVARRSHLVGILAVEGAANLGVESREALTTLCDELALLPPRGTTRAGDTYYPADYEWLQALVEDISETITVMEADGSVRYVSPNVEQVLGYPQEEYVGSNAFAYVHPSDVEEISKSFFERQGSATGTSRPSLEFRVRHADGSWRLMQITARDLLEDPAVRGVVVTSRDVTAERRKERELRRSEARLQAVFRQATEGMFLVDMETRCILESNAAVQRLLGYTDAELRGVTLYDLVAHGRESVDANFRRVAAGIHHIGERRYRRKDGSLVDVAASVSLVSFRGRLVVSAVVRDIGERKRAEAALRESEARFRMLVEQAADALFVHDMSGRLVDVNRRACKSLGCTKDELLRLSVQDIEQNLEPGELRTLWKRVVD